VGKGTYLGGSTIIRPDKGSGPPYVGVRTKLLSKKEKAFLFAVAEARISKADLPPFGKRADEIAKAGGLAAWINRNPARLHHFNACLASLARPPKRQRQHTAPP
jgi:hypothetical protein